MSSAKALVGNAPMQLTLDKANYWQFFRLRQEPFPESNELSHYVPLEDREHLLELLQHLIYYSNVILSLVGVKGAGKTILLNQFKHNLEREGASVIHFTATSDQQPTQFFSDFCTKCKVEVKDIESLTEGVEKVVKTLQRQQRMITILIDNANFLPLSTLELLLKIPEYQSEENMPLHIILFGELDLQNHLEKVAARSAFIDKIHMLSVEGLSQEQTEQYINVRLANAGWLGKSLLSSSEIQKIWKLTHGIPARINRVSKQILFEKTQKAKPKTKLALPTIKAPRSVWITSAGVFVLMVFITLFEKQFLMPSATTPTKATAKITPPAQSEPIKTAVTLPVKHNPAVTASAKSALNSFVEPLHTTNLMNAAIAQTKTTKHGASINDFQLNVLIPPARAEIPTIIHDIGSAEIPKLDLVAVAVAEIPSIPTPTVVTQKTNLIVKTTSYKFDELALLNSTPEYFTIQIAAVPMTNSIKKYFSSHKIDLTQEYRCYQRDKQTVVIVFGKFPSRAAAEHALKNIPEIFRNNHPWIKPLKVVQQQIRAQGGVTTTTTTKTTINTTMATHSAENNTNTQKTAAKPKQKITNLSLSKNIYFPNSDIVSFYSG